MALPTLFNRRAKKDREKQGFITINDRTWSRVFDWLPGRWQQDTPLDREDSVISHPIVYACISRIATDIGKLPPCTESLDLESQIWRKRSIPRYLQILLSPNGYQNHIEFKEWWIYSKLIHGNTYGLLERDREGRVTGIHIMDPTRVLPLVSPNGEVFYRLDTDNLARVSTEQVTVPASEVIHDRINAFFHPLVGLSPLYASKVAAQQGLAIQSDSRRFFENGAQPSGVLVAPGPIDSDSAQRLKDYWLSKFTGENAGNLAVLGDGMKYEPMRMSSVDAQVVAQLDWASETVCSTFGVPPHMVGVGQMPSHDNIEAIVQSYYSNCLQSHIEKFELAVARGLGMSAGNRITLDLKALIRMDSTRRIDMLTKATGGPVLTPNEGREEMGLIPLDGGDTLYLQQQNFSIAALAERDANDPFATPEPAPQSAPAESESEGDSEEELVDEELERALIALESRMKSEKAYARAA